MKRDTITNVLVFCGLVALGVATRWMSDALKPAFSNFTATGAIALFAGYYFRNKLAAVITPLAIIAISNFALAPFNNVGEFVVVYAALLAGVLIGTLVRHKFNVGTVIGGGLASSVCFFLLTNFACWPWADLYPQTLSGTIDSYVAAIPFFRGTLIGDLFFTGVIFGVHWAFSRVSVPALQPAPVEARVEV